MKGFMGFAAIFAAVVSISACGGGGTGTPPPTTPQAAVPTLSLHDGDFVTGQTLTMSATTPGAVIYFTTDGTAPSSSTRVYGGPITVNSSETVKAIAIATGYSNSDVSSATYTIDSSVSLSGLPTLSAAGVAKPSGAPGGLSVLNWAGEKSAATYTFDDSLQSQIDNYDALQATGVHMTFFLICSFDQSSPTWTRAVNDGNELGNHTEHHCQANGTTCGSGTWSGSIQSEYDQCTDHIKTTYGQSNVWTTAAPYGDTGYDSVAATRFFLNRGVEGGLIAPDDGSDPYNLQIYGVNAGETANVWDAQIDAAHRAGKWLVFLFHSIGNDGGYAPVKASEVIASINYGKGLGDVWTDTFVNVGSYWYGQKLVTAVANSTAEGAAVVKWTLPPHFPTGKFLRVTVTGGVLKQNGVTPQWNDAGYYEVALDPGSLTISAN
ncbi:MAG TPA: chitobiase/beta-hexosaminidase C-terminal domain-containing protein [Terracidiphilus sp.]|jgi:peptidoglycan/xylan/chitin deacetylase (PgdA/CDA1 family)